MNKSHQNIHIVASLLLLVTLIALTAPCAAAEQGSTVALNYPGLNVQTDAIVAQWGYNTSDNPGTTIHTPISLVRPNETKAAWVDVLVPQGRAIDIITTSTAENTTLTGNKITITNSTGGISLNITERPTIIGFIVENYSDPLYNGTASIDLLWERENATNSTLIGQLNTEIPGIHNITWTFNGDAATYLTNGTTTPIGDEIHTTFITKTTQAPANIAKGTLTLSLSKTNNAQLTATNNISIRKWLQNATEITKSKTAGTPITWTIQVSAAVVNTSENTTTGWNTCVKFPTIPGYETREIPTSKVTYSTPGYNISNEDGHETIKTGTDIYIKTNTIKNADTMVTITFEGPQLGDVTLNKVLNIADSSTTGIDILRNDELLNGTINKYFADIDGSGVIDAVDVQNINKYLVSLL